MTLKSRPFGLLCMRQCWNVCGVYSVHCSLLERLFILDVSKRFILLRVPCSCGFLLFLLLFAVPPTTLNNLIIRLMMHFLRSFQSILAADLGIIKNILRLPFFRTMGRLTFCAYLIHPTLIRLSYGSMRSPFWSDDIRVVSFVSRPHFRCAMQWDYMWFLLLFSQHSLTTRLQRTAFRISFQWFYVWWLKCHFQFFKRYCFHVTRMVRKRKRRQPSMRQRKPKPLNYRKRSPTAKVVVRKRQRHLAKFGDCDPVSAMTTSNGRIELYFKKKNVKINLFISNTQHKHKRKRKLIHSTKNRSQ